MGPGEERFGYAAIARAGPRHRERRYAPGLRRVGEKVLSQSAPGAGVLAPGWCCHEAVGPV